MRIKLTQVVVMAVLGLFSVSSVNAQQTYKINTLSQGQELRINQGLRSENGQFNVILQSDGNLCLYKNGDGFIKCSMTNAKKPVVLKMQADGNLALYDSKNGHVWSTDTYRGTSDQKGARLVLENNGSLILYSSGGKAIYDFMKGRLY